MARQIIDSYASVTNLTCEVRRERELSGGGRLAILSRVWFQRPNLLNVETVSPVKRRVISDGSICYMHGDGQRKGLAVPVERLPPIQKQDIAKVPGSVNDLLEPLQDLPEVALPPLPDFPQRVGYEIADASFTVLSLDPQGRLARLEVFGERGMTSLAARTDFSAWREVLPGVWLPCLHRMILDIDNQPSTETLRISNPRANQPLPQGVFDSKTYFKDVPFETGAADQSLRAGRAFARSCNREARAKHSADLAAETAIARRPSLVARMLNAPAKGVVWLYRTQIAPGIGQRCSLTPSCSEYFVQALDKHGPLALPMIADRLVREPNVFAEARYPVIQADGRVLYADPVDAHWP